MSATLLGITGNWGIPQDEAGMIIIGFELNYSNQQKPVLTKGGEIQGLSLYQEQTEVKISGLVSKDSPFAGKIGAALAIANAIPAHLQATSSGATILMQVSRSLSNEDFEKIDLTAIHYPHVSLAT